MCNIVSIHFTTNPSVCEANESFLFYFRKVFFFDKRFFLNKIPNNPIPLPGFVKEKTKIICVEKCPTTVVDVEEFYDDENVNLCLYGTTPYVKDECPARTVEPQ